MTPRVPSFLLFLLLLWTSAGLGQSPEFVRLYEEHLAEAEEDPDDPEKWMMVGLFAGVSLRPQEAIRILESIDPTTIPGFNGELYWVYLSGFLNMAGEHERELAAAKQYAEMFPDGRFHPYLSLRSLAAVGRVDEANQLIEAVPPDSTDAPGYDAEGLAALAGHFRDHGYAEAADDFRAREVAWYEAHPIIPDEETDYRIDYAAALYKSARWQEAEALFLQLADENPEEMTARAYRGLLAARRGDAEGATAADAWLADREVSERRPGFNTLYRARIAAAQGDIERAVALLERTLEEGYRAPAELRGSLAWDFEPYLDHPAYRDFLRPRE